MRGASELGAGAGDRGADRAAGALARLNGERRKHAPGAGRDALGAGAEPDRRAARARVPRRRGRLRPLAAGDARRLADALARLAHDHRSLARASRRRDAAAAGRAGSAIERGERRVAAQLRAVSRASGGAGDD